MFQYLKQITTVTSDKSLVVKTYAIIITGALLVFLLVLAINDIADAIRGMISRYSWTAKTLASVFFW